VADKPEGPFKDARGIPLIDSADTANRGATSRPHRDIANPASVSFSSARWPTGSMTAQVPMPSRCHQSYPGELFFSALVHKFLVWPGSGAIPMSPILPR
jgi:hypothetical protein